MVTPSTKQASIIIDSASKENMDKDLDAVPDDKEDNDEQYLEGDAE